MDQWRGKVAVVTGASAGIGAEVALTLANAGLTVIGLARREQQMQQLASSVTGTGRLCPVQCDVTNEAEVGRTFAWIQSEYASIAIFVNNAGMMSSGFLIDGHAAAGGTEEGMDRLRRTIDVNVTAACLCIREAIKVMTDHSGHIVLLNSILGHRIPEVPVPMFNIYPATKFALTGLAQTFRQELRFHGRNIKLTCISPGMVDTDMLHSAFRSGLLNQLPKLSAKDISAAVIYALATPPSVQVNDIILEAVPIRS